MRQFFTAIKNCKKKLPMNFEIPESTPWFRSNMSSVNKGISVGSEESFYFFSTQNLVENCEFLQFNLH